MPNPQKSSKIPFLLAALVFIVLAFYAYSNYNTVTYGGQKYKTVKIGEQTWMAENLNYEAEGSVCYDNNPDNCAKYGRLYDWEAAIKVCPEGWHLPSIEEWDKLLRFVDSDTGSTGPYENRRAGKYLKAVSGWNSYKGYDGNGNGTDKYGFSALPGGRGFSDGSFHDAGDYGFWLGTLENNDYENRIMINRNDYVSSGYALHLYRYSVRCIKDSKKDKPSSSSSVVINYGTPFDYGNKTYKTVKIGTQTWMAENLNYDAEDGKCYKNDPDNCAKYGRLYTWETAKKVCPKGWHLPSNEEWDKLLRFVGGDTGSVSPYKSETAGKHLKAKSGWGRTYYGRNGDGTDQYGFSALPGGGGYSDAVKMILDQVGTGWGFEFRMFYDVGEHGYWWSSSASEEKKDGAYSRRINLYPHYVGAFGSYKSDLRSVRCVQD